jgi:V8-like Glu-specific endopeptidase
LSDWSWVQGTAFLVAPDLALTNRHVLFPPFQGTRLARRVPGAMEAKLKRAYDVNLDFAFDNGGDRDRRYRVVDVPFVAADNDPVDAALLKVERIDGAAPRPLKVTKMDVFDIDRLYVVGHPGRLSSVPDNVAAVFGTPDERKRVSFGWLMDNAQTNQIHAVHDASTIGGYSGGCVLGFADASVQALHFWGDAVNGNRAIVAAALRGHPHLGPMITGA